MIEILAIGLAAAGVVVAVLAWRFPKTAMRIVHFRPGSETAAREPQTHDSSLADLIIVHFRSLTHDSDRVKFVRTNAGQFVGSLTIADLSRILEIMTFHDERLAVVKALSPFIDRRFTSAEYEALLARFTYADDRNRAAQIILKNG